MGNYLVPGLLLAGTVFFGYLYVVGPTQARRPFSEPGPSVPYNQIQQLRQETKVKMDIRRERAEFEKIKRQPMLNPRYKAPKTTTAPELNGGLGPAAHDVGTGSSYEAMNLDQRMDEFLARKQSFEEMEKMQREAYVEAFILEAAKMGFRVTVDSSLEITSVEKIK